MKRFGLVTLLLCSFSVSFSQQVAKSDSLQDSRIFLVVEQPPYFQGGQEQMINYLGGSLKYPEESLKQKIGGKVFVSFIVEPDGSITGTKILKGVSPELDAEALRVVAEMPAWNPGKQNGRPVRVRFILPLAFSPETEIK